MEEEDAGGGRVGMKVWEGETVRGHNTSFLPKQFLEATFACNVS